ncbi:hypothetical protein GKE73_17090 [Paludibacterium sp. dN 18-1]|uniref:Protein NO VEIN C-terminal domain-containing protein n=1 Tax=Paludibacterium denitrificans TaxID=2675226 RepID=A0A844GFN9_9NEIS|nr:hypothetical protein [Paludibacterium denitrificans]
MTRKIEDIARLYLLNEFSHDTYSFENKQPEDRGFDLWLVDKESGTKRKAELKAHNGTYQRRSNLFERLIFNAEIERELFERGDTVIVRVFIGTQPYRVFIITNAILSSGAALEAEARYVLRGQINYDKSFIELA